MKNIFIVFCIVLVSNTIFAQTYKIMTYNIRYDNSNDGENRWSKRKAFLSNQILFNEPGVVGIQEGLHHQVTYLDSVLVHYNYVGVGRDDAKTKGEYSAIFYNNKTFEVIKSSTFWLSETPNKISVGWDASMERICTYALFKNLKTKQRFWVFNTHFDHIGDSARAESSKLIIKTIDRLNKKKFPVIIMGDFNLKPDTKPIQYLSTVFNDSKTVSMATPFGPLGTFNEFKFNEPVKDRIDYIFTSKVHIKVNKYGVLSDSVDCKYPSDHLPVYVELEIKKNITL